jgi:long-chain fatty acid transport protein
MRSILASRWTVAALLLALTPSGARADGWKIQLQGVKALGSAYAGRGVAIDDASTVWFNPAGMTALGETWVFTAGAPVITYQLKFRDAGSRSVLGQPLAGDEADGGKTAPVPHVYLVRRLNDRWHVGFGFNAPFGLGTDYGETWIGRYHATETTLTVYNLNPSVAVRLSDRVSIGGGIDLQRSSATIANMIDFGSLGAAVGLPLVPQQQDGRIQFSGTDWATGFDLGLRIDASSATRFGATYRSEIKHDLEGDADFTVPAAATPLTVGGLLFADTGAHVTLPMPHEVSVSGAHDLSDRWTLLGDFTYTRWSAFKELAVSFDNPLQPPIHQDASWDDSARVAGGVRVRATSKWALRAGAAHETTPVPDATRTPRLPERAHTWLSMSATYTGPRWQWDFSGTHLITPDAGLSLLDPFAGALHGDVHWRLSIGGVSATIRF